MSDSNFHGALTNLQLPSDLLGLGNGFIAVAAQVYTGRRRRDPPRTDGEVWIERLSSEEVGTGLHRLIRHNYRLHVIGAVSNGGPDTSGDAQLDQVELTCREIVQQYNGTRRLYSALPEIKAISAAEDTIDVDPEDDTRMVGTVLMSFLVEEA